MCGSVSDRDVSHILLRLVPLDLIGVVVVVEQGGFPRPGAHPSNPSNPPPTQPRPSPPGVPHRCFASYNNFVIAFCSQQQCMTCFQSATAYPFGSLPVYFGLPKLPVFKFPASSSLPGFKFMMACSKKSSICCFEQAILCSTKSGHCSKGP